MSKLIEDLQVIAIYFIKNDIHASGRDEDEVFAAINHIESLEAKEKGLELDLGLAKTSIYQGKVLLTSCENALLRRDTLIKSLEAENKVLTAKVKELDEILATFPNKCVTCKVFVDPEECYGLEDSDVMACSDVCIDAYDR